MASKLFAHLAQWIAGVAFVSAQATSLPESYPIPEAEVRPLPLDPGLANWLEQHVEQPSILEIPASDYEKLSSQLDVVTRLYIDLARANHKAKSRNESLVLAAAIEHLKDPEQLKEHETLTHPLLPFLYEEVLRSPASSEEIRKLAIAGLHQYAPGSCSQKNQLLDQLAPEKFPLLSDAELLELIGRIDFFRSSRFRTTAYKKFINLVPLQKREVVGVRLLEVLSKQPQLLNQYDWLKSLAKNHAIEIQKGVKKSPFIEPYASFLEAKSDAAKEQCLKAKTLLTSAISSTTDSNSLQEAMAAAREIDSCFKARAPAQRRQFWEGLLGPMEKTYGFAGRAEVMLRIGYIYWVINDYTNAKPSFETIKKEAFKAKQAVYEARASYILGRVAQDEDDKNKAIALFREYVERFAQEENFEDALQALVLILYDKNAHHDASLVLERWIKTQSAKSLDERSVGIMAFALFWAGRIRLEQKDTQAATEFWRRLAAEYYSTYYGAVGHYMLEKLSGRLLEVQPSRTPPFRMANLREHLTPEDRLRTQRIELLMRFGLRQNASCELDELTTDEKKPDLLLLKSLMLHASGQWLEAIKAYDALPRSFRISLPVGFERIVFPRRFADVVYKYSERAKIDPEFVMAIIRQESVFNPLAKSPVGALGLMQLMPNTAIQESLRLSDDYADAAERKDLQAKAHSGLTLTMIDTNVALGVHHVKSLLSKYQSPVYVLSAYNASPSAAKRWMTSIPTQDVLVFIERIPYKETRAYVKLVLRNYFYYKRWYGPPTPNLQHFDTVTSKLLGHVLSASEG